MPINLRVWMRKLHRWGTVATVVPLLIVIVTGVLLLLKKDVAWIQPATMRGAGGPLTMTFDSLLAVVALVPEAEVRTWDDVDRIDVRPDRGVAKVRALSGWEVQVDTRTGEVLQVAYRRSDLIETIHDGSFFHEHVKLWIFLPVGLFVLGLWMTGVYLFILPYLARWKKKPLPVKRNRPPVQPKRVKPARSPHPISEALPVGRPEKP